MTLFGKKKTEAASSAGSHTKHTGSWRRLQKLSHAAGIRTDSRSETGTFCGGRVHYRHAENCIFQYHENAGSCSEWEGRFHGTGTEFQ